MKNIGYQNELDNNSQKFLKELFDQEIKSEKMGK